MKRMILNAIALTFFISGFSQTRAELLKYVSPKTAIDSIGEALADIAMQNPQIKSAEAIATSNKYAWKASKYNLLNDFVVQGNLNEYSIKGEQSANGGLLYPRYNFGLRILVGELFSSGKTAKANFYKYQSTLDNIQDAKLTLRKTVISEYQTYATTQKLLALQQEILQDESITFSKTEEKFKNGELSLEVYSDAGKRYNNEQVKEVTLVRELSVSQANLESLIGMTLENAFRQLSALIEGEGSITPAATSPVKKKK